SRARFAFTFALAAVCCAFGQANNPATDSSSVTMTTPVQLRRIEPPSPTATVEQLEQRGDILRAEKYYADAIDYYEAAIRKSSSAAQLYNKEGIAQLQMLHFSEAKHMYSCAGDEVLRMAEIGRAHV